MVAASSPAHHVLARLFNLRLPPRPVQATCFLKAPAGWVCTPRRSGLTSGLITATTVLDFNTRQAFSGGAGAAARAQQLAAAPLLGTNVT